MCVYLKCDIEKQMLYLRKNGRNFLHLQVLDAFTRFHLSNVNILSVMSGIFFRHKRGEFENMEG